MRLFYAALALEANTFLPLPTSYQAFVEKLYYPPGRYPEKQSHQTGAIGAVGPPAGARRDHAVRRLLLWGAAGRRGLARGVRAHARRDPSRQSGAIASPGSG